jgi:tetratricopeptide (TPR) repeat protein
VRYRKGLLREAKLAMRRALAIEPKNRIAFANLASFNRLTGADQDAEAALRAFLERDPDAIGVRLNLAQLLSDEDREDEALTLLDIAPPLAPGDRQAWAMQRSGLLLNAGRADEAAKALDAAGPIARELEPLKAWRETLLALAKGETGQARDKAQALERSVEAAVDGIEPDHAISSQFALAQFWRRQGEPARAFGFWVAGHRRLQRFQPYDPEAFRAFIDASIEVLDRVRLHGGEKAANRDPAPVFIVGMPRSGTTLTEQILDAHGRTHGAGERNALSDSSAASPGTKRPRRRCGASPPRLRRASTKRRRLTSPTCTRWRLTPRASSTRCPAISGCSASSR